jgi:hypothetical protein
VRRRRADDRERMKPGFRSLQTAAARRDGDLLELLSELVDAHADTVQLIMADQSTRLAWLSHCDYLRALQRLGHETLAHHDQHGPTPPLARAVVSTLNTVLTGGSRATVVVLRGPARAASALAPLAQL